MAERLKLEIKETAHRRRGEYMGPISRHYAALVQATDGESTAPLRQLSRTLDDPMSDLLEATSTAHVEKPFAADLSTRIPRGADCTLTGKEANSIVTFGRTDTVLVVFYLEHVLPFLLPFYRPSAFQGGKSWILELMISSPVVRRAILCQSAYFFSLAQKTASHEGLWETVFVQTRDAFDVLRRSLQVIDGSSVTEHLHGAVRIFASIMQLQRFEIATSNFDNCRSHLIAAVALFKQLLASSGAAGPEMASTSFNTVMNRLGPSPLGLPVGFAQIPSAEQAAFRFTSALLLIDDIIASTVSQEEPRLHEYHSSLLGTADSPIRLEFVVGCQNWVLLHVGEIAVLDAWKQQCKSAGTLSVMELVRRATLIKESLATQLASLKTESSINSAEASSLHNILLSEDFRQRETLAAQSSLVTRVWAHAAFLYLVTVVSGWQPASADVQYHVNRIVELVTCQLKPPTLLSTLVWPFCVAGCLAPPALEARLRSIMGSSELLGVFGPMRKSLEIMERVWRNRDAENNASRDLAACFWSQGDLVLLV